MNDWKKGNPPHKQICGKPLGIPDAVLSTPTASNTEDKKGDIPPPDPGYIRSPALVHQLSLLRENPNITYVFTQPDPHPDHGIQLQHQMGKLFFEVNKNRAIKNGDPKAVGMMW